MDAVGVTVTVMMTSTAPDPTDTSPIPVTVTFSESVAGFTDTDIVVSNGTVNNFAGSGTTYTFDLTPSDAGLVTADIPFDVAQGAGAKGNEAAPQFSRMLEAPVITLQPVARSAYVGDSVAFAVAASGGISPLSYQWRRNGSDTSGATSTDVMRALLILGDAGDYDCVVTNSGGVGSATSDQATLAVADHLQITAQPQGADLGLDAPYTLFVETAGGYFPLTYQWSKEGTPLFGATTSSYEIASFTEADAGTYTVEINDDLTDTTTSVPSTLLQLIGGLPVASPAGLALAAGLLGILRLRRRTK